MTHMHFNVPLGEWEKIPRLQPKTLVGLQYYGEISQDLACSILPQVSLSIILLDHEIPQAGSSWRRGGAGSGTDQGDLQEHGSGDYQRTRLQGPCAPVRIGSALSLG